MTKYISQEELQEMLNMEEFQGLISEMNECNVDPLKGLSYVKAIKSAFNHLNIALQKEYDIRTIVQLHITFVGKPENEQKYPEISDFTTT